MRTKLLYVIVSSENDIYLEQGYVSMFSAKMHMPDCHITLLTDTKTQQSFKGIRKEETKYADEIVTIPLDPTLPGKKRSRLLKTNARNYVDGDFLFIDCDTIVVRDLSSIDEVDYNIAASWDNYCDFSHNPYRNMCIKDVRKLGVDISRETVYFSSGVILAKDNETTRLFFRKWHENYLKGYDKGVSMDQPSMAITNIESGYPIKKISPEWNCVPKHGFKYFKDAYILHYVATTPSKKDDTPLFLLNETAVFLDIKKTGIIPDNVVEVIKDPFKGLANLTHCFAGKEMYFFHTITYSFFIKQFLKQGYKMPTERFFSFYTKLKLKLESIRKSK